jgi:BirA family transcriptional regulator, biotin operon repressor / biotin---[acetyl-CoA-carboxylase] ligase
VLEIEKFDLKLNTDIIGRNFIYAEEIDSTNTFLLDKKNKTLTDGTVVFAERQNKGKGRKERVWYSVKDQNLTFSILLANKKYFGKLVSLINLATSLAVAQSIENLFQLNTNLKWPNDVLIKGKKVCGILLEALSQGSKIERLAIGIGINVNQTMFQGSFNIPPTSIKLESNENIERERLLAEVLNNFEELLERILTTPEVILKDWKSRCRMIGEKIEVSDNNISKYGVFDDLDENGFLLLKSKDNKIEKIYFGDVSVQ